jgi:hypothetical protein
MMEAAKEMVADNPKSFFGLYWMNLLTPSLNDNSPAALDTGAKAGNGLLAIVEETFSPAKKPQNVNDDAWAKEKSNTVGLGNRTLGWVAMQKGNNDEAEKFFVESLKSNGADAQVSLWTGTAIARQKKLEKQGVALYHFARAGNYDGPGALPQQARDAVKASFEKNYVNFRGGKDGMDQVVSAAKTTALPPADFKLKSKDEMLMEQEESLKKTNPNLALWVGIKNQLTGANGAQYFDSSLKNAAIPGGADVGGTKIEKIKAKAVSCNPAAKPKEVIVGISSPDMSEVTLRFENPVGCPAKGTDIEFSGVPIEFVADPFNLVFSVEPEDVIGVPKGAAAPKAGAPKKAAPKKK